MENVYVKSEFFTKRLKGFIYILSTYGSMYLANLVFSRSDIDVMAIISNLMISVISIVALLGLADKDYKLYAQGALVGWLFYAGVSVGLKIILKI